MQDSSSTHTIQLEDSWKERLLREFGQPYFQHIRNFLRTEKSAGRIIYQPGQEIFQAYQWTPFDAVKVVIIGQDPYHGPGQAHGLCFSVRKGVKPPPSLVNIFKEIRQDLGYAIPDYGCLESWARQGVFLLNAILTVEKDKPASHRHIGWQQFTDATIQAINTGKEHVVFLLWGAFAHQKEALIDQSKHLVLKAAHPSPFSADKGFFGCRHFSQANAWLQQKHIEPVNWQLT